MAKGRVYCAANSSWKQGISDKKKNMNHRLYLLRHAKAEPWSPGINDFDRKLSQRGHDHMLRLSAWMLENLPAPDMVLCSPSRRTRETLAPFFDTWPELRGRVVYPGQIYEGTAGTLHELATSAFETSGSVMIVGHNPGFEYLAVAVLRDFDAAGIDKMATGTLAVIDFDGAYAEQSGNGVLRHWLRRKNLLQNP
jgi:phosphohistidine phosphatase SixA